MVSHNLATQTAAVTSLMLMAAFVCGHYISISKLRNVPQSTAAIAIGALSGIVLFMWNPKLAGAKSLLTFNPELFYMFMLPPIVLEAGFTLDRINFCRNFKTIMWLAIGGTLISAVVTTLGLYVCANYIGFQGNPTEQLLYCAFLGTLLAAVDPVATLGVLGGSRFEANEKLFSIVFGESLLNDTVSIVIFRTLVTRAPKIIAHAPTPLSLFTETFVTFCYASFISCIIGGVTGIMAYLCFRSSDTIQRFPEYELGVMLLIAYFSFAMAEMFEGSGIVSLFITSILLGHYNVRNLSITSQRTSGLLFKVLSVFSEAFIYVLLGLVFSKGLIAKFVGGSRAAAEISSFNISLFLITSVLLLVGRALVIFPSATVINALEYEQASSLEDKIDHQLIAKACMHAVFRKNQTSRYTPLAKSVANSTAVTRAEDDFDDEPISLPITCLMPPAAIFAEKVGSPAATSCNHCGSPVASGGDGESSYQEKSSFISRGSAFEFLEQGSPNVASLLKDVVQLEKIRTPYPREDRRRVLFEEESAAGEPAALPSHHRFGFLPDGTAEVLARLPGQKIHEYVEELRAYRQQLREQNRLYSQVLDFPCQVLLWMSGLRGAIAFVLALSVPTLHTASGRENYKLIVTTTLAIILVSTVMFGSCIEMFALKFQIIRRIEEKDEGEMFSSPPTVSSSVVESPARWSNNSVIDGCRQLWHSIQSPTNTSLLAS